MGPMHFANRRWSQGGLLLLASLLVVASALAQLPVLNGAGPVGLLRGSKAEVHLHGKYLNNPKKIIFYHDGISAGEPVVHDDKHVSFPVTIAEDCALGEHPIRLHCANGVTYQRTLWVTSFAITDESKEANDSQEQAQEIALNSCVRGVADKEDVDFYKVMVKKGQRLSVEVYAMRLGKTFFDAHLSLFDPEFRAIATSDDTALSKQDPYLSVVAQSDGFHYLAVREASYEGSDRSRYLLSIGDFLRPSAVYPPGAAPDKATEFTFIQADGSEHRQTLTPTAVHVLASDGSSGTSITPNPIRLSPLPYLNEVEPNNAAKEMQPALALPCAFHGIIEKSGDVDWFKFSAKKGQDIRVQVSARRLGSPLDARIILRDPKGKHLANNDDSNHPDSRVDFKIPADGDYIVNIRDHLGKGGPTSTYRIEITERTPSVSAFLNREDRNDSQKSKVINIPRGASLAYKLNIGRDRTSVDLTPYADQLPKGVKLHAMTAAKGMTNIPLYFSAAGDAPLAAGLYSVGVRSEDGKFSSPIRETIEHVSVNNQGVFHQVRSDRLSICVTEAAPFDLILKKPTVPAAQSGNIQFEILCTPAEGFEKDITLTFPWLPPGITAPSSVKVPKGKGSVQYPLTIAGDCKAQTWELCVNATAVTDKGTVLVSSNLVPLVIKPPYLSAKLEMAATTQGVDTSIVCQLEHHASFNGKAELTVHGLPDGITAAPVTITQESEEVLIPVTVAADARTGKYSNLFCQIQVPENSQHIAHITGQGGSLRIDPPPKNAPKVTASKDTTKKPAPKKPLSRLEQLRLEHLENNDAPAAN